MEHAKFWAWVASMPTPDCPIGDFVRDTQGTLAGSGSKDPNAALAQGGYEAREIYKGLKRVWDKWGELEDTT